MKLHWSIEVLDEAGELTSDLYLQYLAVATVDAVKTYMERTVREMIAAHFPDGDNAYYEVRDDMDDAWNPGLHYFVYDHNEDGPFLLGISAYSKVGIEL